MSAITKILLSLSTGLARYLSASVDSNDYVRIIDDSTGLDVKIYGGIKIGSGTNFVEIQTDGTIVLNGSSSVYDDALGALIVSKLDSPASAIQDNLDEAGLDFRTTCRYPDDHVVISSQLTHRWKAASVIHPHLHWEQTSASIPNWLIGVRWQIIGSAKTTAWTLSPTTGNAFTYVSGTLNQIATFAAITPPTGYNISDIIQVRLYRDYTNASGLFAGADPIATTVFASSFDSHVETDRLGSTTEYAR